VRDHDFIFLQAREAFITDSLDKLELTSKPEAALATADLVIEAITENLPLKQVIAVPVLKNF
jgi:3-hydroxyacyl-CoA dehydrogenase